MLGLGLDDMFVVCNSLDQVSFYKPSDQRIREAVARAGPSITLTSLTDALCFFVGSVTVIPALSSFCIYCSVSIAMLYFAILTIFLPVLHWETQRVKSGSKECCGLLFCHETKSYFFCKGRLLSKAKLDFSTHRLSANEQQDCAMVPYDEDGE